MDACLKLQSQFRKILEDVNINIFPQNILSGLCKTSVVLLYSEVVHFILTGLSARCQVESINLETV